MRLLLIKPKQIGDSLILTPTLAAIKQAHPEAEIWVVVRRGCEGILAGCPQIARLLTVAPVEKRERRFWRDLRRDAATFLQVATTRFDAAFELGDGARGRHLLRSALLGRARYSVRPTDAWGERDILRAGGKIAPHDWSGCHRVEKDFGAVSEFLPLPRPIGPLVFDAAADREWPPARGLTDYAVLQIGTRQGFNRWHREGWMEVARALLGRVAHVVVACGPVEHERAEAAWLQAQLGARALSTEGGAGWAHMAWLLRRARLFVGPNTASMHLAAACGCPVVALFGPSIEDHWHPWRVPYRIVTTPGYAPPEERAERYARIKQRSMGDIRARDVIDACHALLAEPSATQPPCSGGL
jgi:heptosyltransferase-3